MSIGTQGCRACSGLLRDSCCSFVVGQGGKRIRTLPDGDERKGDTAAKMALNQGTSGFIVSMDHAFSDLNQLKGSGFHFHAYLITPFIP